MTIGSGWSSAENVLCVRLDYLGDVLMTTPAIRAVKQSHPGRRVTLLTSPSGQSIARLIPEIDDVIAYDAPWLKATPPRANSKPEYEMAELLRSRGFDAAIVFTVYSQNPLPSAFLCYLAGIPLRLAHCRENPYQLLTDWVREREPEEFVRHEVRRQLDLAASVGYRAADERMSLRVPEDARARARSLRDEMGVNLEEPWVLIHPGATAPSRRYAPAGFAEAARALAAERGWQVVFTGTDAESELVEEIRGVMQAPSYSTAGRLDLAGLAALVSLAPLLISNNTGPVHIASAVGTPVVDLYALTNPQHTPWCVPNRVLFHDVPCKYCYKSVCPLGHNDCLQRVTPQQIVQAAEELLRETKSVTRDA